MKHVHAELMLQYAKDAMETDEPWKKWEKEELLDVWFPLLTHPIWAAGRHYRRKPSIIRIGDFFVPGPVRNFEELVIGQKYWIVDIYGNSKTFSVTWTKEANCIGMYMSEGLVHFTKEAAVMHSVALLTFTTK